MPATRSRPRRRERRTVARGKAFIQSTFNNTLGLPAHGQRTRTNARTRKGRPKTVAGRKRAVMKK